MRRARPARDRLPRGLRQGRRRRAAPVRGEARVRRLGALGARPRRRLAARALHLLARGLRRVPWRSACPWRPTSTRARTSSTGCCAAKAPGSRWRRCWSSRRARAASAASPRPGCSTNASPQRTASRSTRRRSGCSPRHGVAVTHCPRSNALLGCGIAPLAELRAAGLRVGIGTDGVSSVPSHDFFEELRTVISFARAQVGARRRAVGDSGAGARDPRRRPRARARRRRSARSSPASGQTSTIVSLSGSPYLPWEDPAAAVVYGGSPGASRGYSGRRPNQI